MGAVAAALGDAAFAAAWAKGQAMPLEQVIAYGLEASDGGRLASDNNQLNASNQTDLESA